jgi:transcriptional regulator with XRE-family HTH domain
MFDFPVIDMVRTGQNIRNLRIAAGLSVRDVQEAFGFATPQAIYKWQRGMAMPTIDNMLALAVLFGVTIDELLVVDGMPEMHIGRGA